MSPQHYFQFTLSVMCKFPISIFDFPYLHLIQNHNLREGFDKHFYQQQRTKKTKTSTPDKKRKGRQDNRNIK